MPDAPPTRPSLLLRLRDHRDDQAWGEFVDLYAPLVYAYARRHRLRVCRFRHAARRKVRRRAGDEVERLGRIEVAQIALVDRESRLEAVVADALPREPHRHRLGFDCVQRRAGPPDFRAPAAGQGALDVTWAVVDEEDLFRPKAGAGLDGFIEGGRRLRATGCANRKVRPALPSFL